MKPKKQKKLTAKEISDRVAPFIKLIEELEIDRTIATSSVIKVLDEVAIHCGASIDAMQEDLKEGRGE